MAGPLKLSDSTDAILVRDCRIEGPDGQVSPLTLSFLRPTFDEDGTFTATLRMSCKHFDKEKKVHGFDELQAFSLLLTIGLVLLQSLEGQG